MDQSLHIERDRAERMPFGSTVCVRTGDNTTRAVKSVRGACEVLIDWPHARRGPVYQSTMEVLQAALAGKASVEQAHDAFLAFASHADVLVT
ncbi:DUF982 domain-containing protein [Mesorhizobium marinum]|uniref:DUF982 domain-containing protein n=1 Tax=Mesorhizobium marinum TaxID=3228790 RepID=UPI003466AF48